MILFKPGIVQLVLLFLSHLIFGMKYLEFSNQKEVVVKQATNYAILNGGSTSKPDIKGFTICGSIYVGFYRSKQAFYTLSQNSLDILWFSLYL